jgi:hypothetical protein
MTEPYPDEMFEEAERREAENKALEELDKLYKENAEGMKKLAEHERIEVIQTAVAGIGKYSDALKALAETEKVELRAELEAKKKENWLLMLAWKNTRKHMGVMYSQWMSIGCI